MWYSARASSNEQVSLTADNRAVVAGGTQGIGGGIALRFALAGASVWIIGRSEQRGQQMVEKLQQASQEGQRRRLQNDKAASASSSTTSSSTRPDHAFLQGDLSDVDSMKRVADSVIKKAGRQGIDWLVECQGGPPSGNSPDTPAGIDSCFAVQCLSRYAIAKRLLEAGTIKKGVCMVAAPANGSKKPLNLDDIECRKGRSKWGLNLLPTAQRDSSVLDAAAQVWAEKYPNVTITHIFPGLVGTSATKNQGFPFPIPQLSSIGSYILPSPQQFAEVPFYLSANSEGQRYLRSGEANLFGPTLKRLDISPNVASKEVREAVIAKLDSYGV